MNAARSPEWCVGVVRRQSPDWGALSADEFAAQSRRFYRLLGRPENRGVEMAQLWDRTFTVSFCQARQAMKELASANLRRVEGVTLLEAGSALQEDARDGTIWCFVDDDDWLRADFGSTLAASAAPHHDGYRWRQIRCGRHRGKWLSLAARLDACGTNNYAVSTAFLRSNPGNLERVFQHFDAEIVFGSLRVCTLAEATLSATNRHPASTMLLERALEEEFSSDRLAAMVEDYNRRLAEPLAEPPGEGVAWVLPWVDAVREFYRTLAAGRRE